MFKVCTLCATCFTDCMVPGTYTHIIAIRIGISNDMNIQRARFARVIIMAMHLLSNVNKNLCGTGVLLSAQATIR